MFGFPRLRPQCRSLGCAASLLRARAAKIRAAPCALPHRVNSARGVPRDAMKAEAIRLTGTICRLRRQMIHESLRHQPHDSETRDQGRTSRQSLIGTAAPLKGDMYVTITASASKPSSFARECSPYRLREGRTSDLAAVCSLTSLSLVATCGPRVRRPCEAACRRNYQPGRSKVAIQDIKRYDIECARRRSQTSSRQQIR